MPSRWLSGGIGGVVFFTIAVLVVIYIYIERERPRLVKMSDSSRGQKRRPITFSSPESNQQQRLDHSNKIDMENFWKLQMAQIFDFEHFKLCKSQLCNGCILITYSNKTIIVAEGGGFIHGARKTQYLKMIDMVTKTYDLPEFRITINLNDEPKECALNFCRPVGARQFLLLPNHRFFGDDTLTDLFEDQESWPTWPQVLVRFANLRSAFPFEGRSKQMFLSGRPHPKKVKLIEYALDRPEMFNIQLLIQKPHCWMGMGHGPRCVNRTNFDGQCPFCSDCPSCIRCIMHGSCSNKTTPQEQLFLHRYLIYIDGNTRSDRMKHLLLTGSCILNIASEYEEFYSHFLVPWTNYIPIDEKMSNFTDGYEYALNNNQMCKEMADSNTLFASTFLSERSILAYMATLINHTQIYA